MESLGISSDGTSYVSHGSSSGAHASGKKRPMLPAMPKWLVGAVAASLVLVAAAFAGWMILGAKASIGDDARFLPDDTNFVFAIDVKSLVTSGVGQKFKDQLSDLHEIPSAAKLKIEDIGRVTFGGQISGEKFCSIAHFNRPVSIDDLWNSDGGAKTTVGAYTVRSLENGKMAAAQIDPQLILFGNKEEVQKVLTRNGPPRYVDGLADAINEADWNKPVAVAITIDGIRRAAAAANPAMGPAVDQLRGMAASADVGDDIRLSFAAICKDSTVADSMRKQLDGMKAALSSRPAAALTSAEGIASKKIVDSLTISQSGATLRAAITLDSATVQGGIEAARALAGAATTHRQTSQPDASAIPKPAAKPTPPNSDKPAIKPPARMRNRKKSKDSTKQPPDPAAPSN